MPSTSGNGALDAAVRAPTSRGSSRGPRRSRSAPRRRTSRVVARRSDRRAGSRSTRHDPHRAGPSARSGARSGSTSSSGGEAPRTGVPQRSHADAPTAELAVTAPAEHRLRYPPGVAGSQAGFDAPSFVRTERRPGCATSTRTIVPNCEQVASRWTIASSSPSGRHASSHDSIRGSESGLPILRAVHRQQEQVEVVGAPVRADGEALAVGPERRRPDRVGRALAVQALRHEPERVPGRGVRRRRVLALQQLELDRLRRRRPDRRPCDERDEVAGRRPGGPADVELRVVHARCVLRVREPHEAQVVLGRAAGAPHERDDLAVRRERGPPVVEAGHRQGDAPSPACRRSRPRCARDRRRRGGTRSACRSGSRPAARPAGCLGLPRARGSRCARPR